MKFEFSRKTSPFIKAEQMKKYINTYVDETMSPKEMLVYLNHLINFNRKLRKKLSDKELLLKDVLEKVNVNPYSAYRWIRTSLTPEDLIKRVKGKGRKFSMKRAEELLRADLEKEKATLHIMILDLSRKIVEGLE